jgi:hypothetical protein
MSKGPYNSTRVIAKGGGLVHAHIKGSMLISLCEKAFYNGRKYIRNDTLVTCLSCYAKEKF